MDWSAYSRLTFDYPAEGVLLIKINRPDRLNAMDPTTAHRTEQGLARCRPRRRVPGRRRHRRG